MQRSFITDSRGQVLTGTQVLQFMDQSLEQYTIVFGIQLAFHTIRTIQIQGLFLGDNQELIQFVIEIMNLRMKSSKTTKQHCFTFMHSSKAPGGYIVIDERFKRTFKFQVDPQRGFKNVVILEVAENEPVVAVTYKWCGFHNVWIYPFKKEDPYMHQVYILLDPEDSSDGWFFSFDNDSLIQVDQIKGEYRNTTNKYDAEVRKQLTSQEMPEPQEFVGAVSFTV